MTRSETPRPALTALRRAVLDESWPTTSLLVALRREEADPGAARLPGSTRHTGRAQGTGGTPAVQLGPGVVPAPSAPAEHPSAPAGRPVVAPDAAAALRVPEGSEAVARLVQQAQDGDAEAFGSLYDHYVDLVYRYIYFRVGGRALAEDLTSETFLRALRRITSFTWQGRDFGAWLITIARNLVADHYKSGRYRLEITTADMLDADRAEEGPEGEVLDALQNVVLLNAVKGLNPEQQECIVLRFLQGLSVAETALAMGKNEGAIKALQYRAVRTLGRLLPEGLEL